MASNPDFAASPAAFPSALSLAGDSGAARIVTDLFAEQVARRPDALAVAQGARRLTFGELDRGANALARRLRDAGAGPDVPVGVRVGRSPEMIVSLLAVLKSGSAYVPLDPAAPAARTAAMLENAGAPILVADAAAGVPGPWRRVDPIGDDGEAVADGLPPLSPDFSHRLAYVIFTSGSTGEPKGVEIEHHSLSNLIDWHLGAFGITSEDRTTQLAHPGFDAAVWEIWPTLAAGATLHLADEDVRRSPEALRDWLVREKITVSFAPTPLAEALMALPWPEESALRCLLTGGDVLHSRPEASLPFIVVNNYGPTEATVVATSGPVPASPSSEPPTIGRAVAGVETLVLDESGAAVAEGEAGELLLGGAGLARGYSRRPDLTAEKFIPHPFRAGARLYRTGDRVRRLPGGELAYLGRVDEQIKIRGFRIEPAEIQAALERHPAVLSSLVVAREGEGAEKMLVAYVVLARRESDDALRAHLREELPEYMHPAAFVPLEAFPLTPHGKIDRAALPPPPRSRADGAPRSPLEERVARMAAELLRLERVGIDENFFAIGGHSLLGTQLIARVRDAFGVELALRKIFEAPTVARLSAEIERLLRLRIEEMSEEEAERLAGRPASAAGSSW